MVATALAPGSAANLRVSGRQHRQYAADAKRRFYQFGEYENASICGSSTYPCGSVTGTPGYMCVSELQRKFGT